MVSRVVRFLGAKLTGIIEVTFPELWDRKTVGGRKVVMFTLE